MTRVNITVPDEIIEAARSAGLNVSRVATQALASELDRRHKIAELDAYLAALETELGPVSIAEAADAAAWADQIPSAAPTERQSTPSRRRSA